MASKIFVFVGFILLATTALLYFTLDSASLTINGKVTNDPDTIGTVKFYLCGGLGLLGGLFSLLGLRGMIKESNQAKRIQYILQNGLETQGLVVFVDKNYTLLMNNRPIYSIVEYNYQDKAGNQYTRRINNMNSEMVIRMNIIVGSTVKIKYLSENPSESALFF